MKRKKLLSCNSRLGIHVDHHPIVETNQPAGERIFNLERHLNCLEGIRREDDTLPARILKEVREDGWPGIRLQEMLDQYYRLRGWNGDGRPKPVTLKRLGLARMSQQGGAIHVN